MIINSKDTSDFQLNNKSSNTFKLSSKADKNGLGVITHKTGKNSLAIAVGLAIGVSSLAGIAVMPQEANAATTSTQQSARTSSPVKVLDSKVQSITVKHTANGAVATGKLASTGRAQKVALRVGNTSLRGQTGNFEWEYTDSSGNFSINISDAPRSATTRYWQLEAGGGNWMYDSYGKVMASGTVSSDTSATYPAKQTPAPSTPTTPPSGPSYTNGKGGAFTTRMNVPYSAEGLSSQYHIYADGIDSSKPVGVMFEFHGDGGDEFLHPSRTPAQLAKVAKEKNMILVVAKAPNRDNSWWRGDIDKNGAYMRSLITSQVYQKYNINKKNVWLVGYSGGAEFISYEMMEGQSDLMTGGGAVLMGGGGAPSSFDRQPTSSLKSSYRMLWHTGLKDNMGNSDPGWSAISTAREGAAWYKNHGFTNVSIESPANEDHFSYDQASIVKSFMNKK